MMRKCFLCFLAAVLLCQAAVTQAAADLLDPFYSDLTIWENIGLINDAPAIRPYPLQEIKRILLIIEENGDETQKRKAAEHRNRFFGRVFHFGGSTDIAFQFPNKEKEFFFTPFLEINYEISRLLTVSGYGSFNIFNKLGKEELYPKYKYSTKDIASDSGSIGSMRILPMFNSSAAIGTPEYYFTMGLARTSLGPMHNESIFLGGHAFHAGQFIFSVNKEKWAYNHVFLTISASDDKVSSIFPGKFLSIHTLTYRPLSWLSIAFVDSMVFGGRFEPFYLIPFSVFFLGQSIFNFPDNSMLGLTCTVKPVQGLRFDLSLYADDLGFNEIVKFKRAKWRLAGQFGFSYTMPKTHWFSCINLDYTLVTPYTYVHADSYIIHKPNYQNYTHHALPLGSNLDPNSDRINLNLKFTPVYGLELDFFNTFIRHGNITESVDDFGMLKDYLSKEYNTDGSIFNHSAITRQTASGNSTNKEHAFLYDTPFMTQNTIEYINQLGFEVSCRLPILKSGGLMQFKLGYVFEADINSGVASRIYEPVEKFSNSGWHERNLTNEEKAELEAEAKKQLSEWRSAARSKNLNHYIRISAKISY